MPNYTDGFQVKLLSGNTSVSYKSCPASLISFLSILHCQDLLARKCFLFLQLKCSREVHKNKGNIKNLPVNAEERPGVSELVPNKIT